MIAPAEDVIELSAEFAPQLDIVVNRLRADEADQASAVLVEAYRSSDDSLDGDGEQLNLFWAGEWGPPVPEATFCARQLPRGHIVGLSLVCLLDGLPLVAHLVVAEPVRRKGVAAALLAASAGGLLAVGIDTVELAVGADNRNALHLYTRLGFRLDAPGCLQRPADARPWIGYTELPAFDGLRASMLAAMPDLDVSPDYVVGMRDAETDQPTFPLANTSAGHHLPGWILALVTGWRSGQATIAMSARELDAAIVLLSPAEAATVFDHPNLKGWRSLRRAAAENPKFVVQYSTPPLGHGAASDVR